MAKVKPSGKAARVRAARGYAGLEQPDFAELFGISKETVSRIENGKAPISDEFLADVARKCPGVPVWFMQHGFAPPVETGEQDLRDRVGQLEAVIRQLPNGDELRELVAGSRHTTQVFKSAADAAVAQESAADSDTRDEADATREAPRAPTEEKPGTGQKHAP